MLKMTAAGLFVTDIGKELPTLNSIPATCV